MISTTSRLDLASNKQQRDLGRSSGRLASKRTACCNITLSAHPRDAGGGGVVVVVRWGWYSYPWQLVLLAAPMSFVIVVAPQPTTPRGPQWPACTGAAIACAETLCERVDHGAFCGAQCRHPTILVVVAGAGWCRSWCYGCFLDFDHHQYQS
jgi:hypothetical protein